MAILDDSRGYIDPNSVSVTPTGNKWGLILGIVGVILSLLFTMTGMIDYTGVKSNAIPTTIQYAAMAAIFYMAIKAHRDEDLGGFISLGRCVKLAAYMGLIAGVITAVYTFVYFKFIQPDFMSGIMDAAMNKAEDKGQDPEQVKKGMEMMSWMFNPGAMAIMGFLGTILIAAIIGLIEGLIMKKDPPRPF